MPRTELSLFPRGKVVGGTWEEAEEALLIFHGSITACIAALLVAPEYQDVPQRQSLWNGVWRGLQW